MLYISEHRTIPDRLSDLLPWAALVAQGVVLNKDGSFQKTISYRGPDLDSATPDELVYNAQRVNDIFRRLGTGWAVFAESQRFTSSDYPSTTWHESYPLPYLLDKEREDHFRQGEHFESRYFLTFIYLPPAEIAQKLFSRFVEGASSVINYQTALDNFISDVTRYTDLLRNLFPEARALDDEETLTYLHSCISVKRHSVSVPEVPMYLDAILADSSLTTGFEPRLGDNYIAAIGLMGFPGASQPGILDALNRLPIEYRWCTRFICLDQLEAKKELETFRRKWFAKRKSITTLIKELCTKEESPFGDSDALQKSGDADAALQELGSGYLGFGYFTSAVILRHSSRDVLRAMLGEVERVINTLGFVAKTETVNCVDAWLGTIPGNTRANIRRPLLSTTNLAHLIPGASAVWAGPERDAHMEDAPLLLAETGGSTPFRFSLHCGDVGHALVLGPTGAGKSTLLNLMEAQFLRYPNAQVYIFDKGASSRALTAGVGGDFYDLGAGDNPLSFQPLQAIDDQTERRWAHEWALSLLTHENIAITPTIKKLLWDALQTVAQMPLDQRTLWSLQVCVQDEGVRRALQPYTFKGAHGYLLDSRSEGLGYNRWQVFEMEHVMQTPSIVQPILSYLFHRLEQRFTGDPTLLVLDEAWLFLDHPGFSEKIREWLKTLRKKNVSVIFATQSLSDVQNSTIAPTLKEACLTKVFLPNLNATSEEASKFYSEFGLNKRQIQLLSSASPRRDYYYNSRDGNRMFSLALSPIALAYCTGATPEQHELIKHLQLTCKTTPEFNKAFLSEFGLHEAARELHQLTQIEEAA